MIASQLREQIASGEFKAGQPIPSYRALMEAHGVTVGTVRQAVMTLQAEGLIESVSGVGCVVAEPRALTHRVGIAMLGVSEAPGIVEQLTLMHDELDRLRCDVGLRFVPTVNGEAIDALVRWGRRHDGVLLRGRVPAEVARVVADAGVRMVVLGEPVDEACPAHVSNVTVDVSSTIGLAVGHLVSLGHRRIALCSSIDTRYYVMVSQAFRECMKSYGLGAEMSEWYHTVGGPDSREAVPAWMSKLRVKPTALLVEAESRAAGIMEGLKARGVRVPRDLSVLAIASAIPEQRESERINCVLTPTRELILRGTAMLVEMIRAGSPSVRVEKIVARYLPGRTCVIERQSLAGPGGKDAAR